MSNEATPTPDKAKLVTVKLEVVYEVDDLTSINQVFAAARGLLVKAREHGGKPTGQVIFGRQKFDLE